ncbi:bifunctional phosphatase PAP2/diacylglycerol kinase family protein [Actinomycetospora lemnae]|uniref:Diacylglycerol kinase family protein n=1 Tax=Actinomycetospora lemnae TaxID=3019891 RepID=A0ABT5SNY0_9PSEU|nr:diacylglycerol kinase family protein [Actinomycetospora sp. DW7H6]MDD7964541.1 diacylglycerol kinase family protein [Actinomycetospora sp. DW7H6]
MSDLPGVDRSPVLPRWLARLDRTADRGLLWAVVAGGLMASGRGPRRRAGVRGVMAAAATSAIAHALAKPLLPRALRHVAERSCRAVGAPPPRGRRFPSAHAASSTAFVTAAGMESPLLGGVLAPVAIGVSTARVVLGERTVEDVVAGAGLGIGVALLTRRWWPVVRHAPARARPAGDAPALGDGAGLVVVANSSAGTPGPLETLGQIVAPVIGVGDTDGEPEPPAPPSEIHEVLPRAQVIVPEPGIDFVDEVEAALDRPTADGTEPRAIGVAGGDGSVAALAGLAQRRRVPLMVLPEGTLNHFARDVGIDDTPTALTAAREGDAVLVDVGVVDITAGDEGETRSVAFVNTASLGGYPDMVRLRESWEERWGKWPSAAFALVRVLAEASPLVVELDGKRRTIWLLFVGNGGYEPRGMAPLFRPRLDARVLDVRFLRADVPFSRTRFVVSVLAGTLSRSRVYVANTRTRLSVRVVGPPVGLATDGEVQPDADRFVFRIAPGAIPVYRPREV